MKEKSIFFIHIPKTGGTTIETLLIEAFGRENVCPCSSESDFLSTEPDISKFKVFCGHNWYHTEQILPKPLFIFSFLRDPVKRTISAYEHIKRAKDHGLHDVLNNEAPTLWEYLNHRVFSTMVANPQTRIICADADYAALYSQARKGEISIEKATSILTRVSHAPPNQDQFDLAIARLEDLDFVGITEHFDTSIRMLFQAMAKQAPASIPKMNPAPAQSTNSLKAYSAQEIDLVRQMNEFDIRLYDRGLKLLMNLDPSLRRNNRG